LPPDPAVANNALAIRIVFPLIGATPVSCNRPGLPAPLGKPQKALRAFLLLRAFYFRPHKTRWV
ncbi:MAG: hypothetical protein RBR38_10055, partial [Desulfomicrobium apsheronum]|nr:hypothetical protein [Desulfomicrobium apsheronum]